MAASYPDVDEECLSCGEGMPVKECPRSYRECGHHCNHSWDQDQCCWCGEEFGECDPLDESQRGMTRASSTAPEDA